MSVPTTQPFATMESVEIATDPMSVGAGLDTQEITATMSSTSASRTLARIMEPATTWSMITLVLVFQDLMVSFDQLCHIFPMFIPLGVISAHSYKPSVSA